MLDAIEEVIKELRQRHVFRVAAIYGVLGWLVVQLATVIETNFLLAESFDSIVTAVLFAGLPVALVMAWTLEMTPDGIRPAGTNAALGEPDLNESSTDYVFAGASALLIAFLATDIIVPDRAVPQSAEALAREEALRLQQEDVVKLPAATSAPSDVETAGDIAETDPPTGSVVPHP